MSDDAKKIKVSTFSIQIDTIQEIDITDICSITFKYVKESVKGSLISLVRLKLRTTQENMFRGIQMVFVDETFHYNVEGDVQLTPSTSLRLASCQ